jgi:hypothetical protein
MQSEDAGGDRGRASLGRRACLRKQKSRIETIRLSLVGSAD